MVVVVWFFVKSCCFIELLKNYCIILKKWIRFADDFDVYLRDHSGNGVVDVPESKHRLVELEQVITHEFLHKVGWHESSSSVQGLGIEEAVLVGLTPDEEVVATLHGQFGLGILVGRVLEGLVGEASDVDVAASLAGYVEHVNLAVEQTRWLGRQYPVEWIRQNARGYLGHLTTHRRRGPQEVRRPHRCWRWRARAQALLDLIYYGLLLELVCLGLDRQLVLYRLQGVAYRLQQATRAWKFPKNIVIINCSRIIINLF